MASEALKVFLGHLNLFLKNVKVETKEEPFTVAALVLDYNRTSGKYSEITDAEGSQADSSIKTWLDYAIVSTEQTEHEPHC